jgi:hypothetical protein
MIFTVEDRLYCTTYIGIDRSKKWGQYVMRYDRALKRKEMGSDANEKKREKNQNHKMRVKMIYIYTTEKKGKKLLPKMIASNK